eukprot:TRINITY_DN338_c1_g1_i1.p1 TRINITY_DN338_c1_g1~~TRINITY_DN338_c1_g1_i1.p1  ORF type:complete len:403 (-),score=129.29 TRINITY_DN338_c1_g1_i1:319-1527(-)
MAKKNLAPNAVEADAAVTNKKRKAKKAVVEPKAEEPAPETPADVVLGKKKKKKAKQAASEPEAQSAPEVAEATPAAASGKKKKKKAATSTPAADEPEKKKKKVTEKTEQEELTSDEVAKFLKGLKEEEDFDPEAELDMDSQPLGNKPKPARTSSFDNGLTVFVGNIPRGTDEETIRQDFAVCGQIAKMQYLKDAQGKFKGSCFITFTSKVGVGKALEYDGDDYGGRALRVHVALNKEDREGMEFPQRESTPDKNSLKVFIGGIPFGTDEATLRADFEECGEIDELTCLKNDDGRDKGIAFITFKTKAGVEEALKYDGEDYGGRTLKVSMATARSSKDKGNSKDKGKGGGKAKGKGKDKGKESGKHKGKDQKGKGKGKGKDKGKGKGKGEKKKSVDLDSGSDD